MIVNQTHEKIRRIICGNTVFFILKWGRYWVAHVHQPETGSYKDMGSNTTIIDALQYFTPNVIVSLGIAFGIDYQTQNIGDVLVSRRVLPYSENKRDEDKVKPDRSQDKTIDNWLHVRLVNANGFIDSITYGDILSGDSVLSSFQEKDKICLGYTKTDFIIGGEMEGSAIFQFADSDGIPGVVIKGICDWGVAKNDIFPDDTEKEEKFKESLQAMAMVCAVEKSTRLFKDPELFTEPKNANIKHLRKEQLVYRWCLSLTTIILFLLGVFELIWNHGFYRFDQSLYNAISSPFLLVCMAAALLGVLLHYSYLWKKIKTASYSTDRELKNAVSHIDLEKDSYAETRDGKKAAFCEGHVKPFVIVIAFSNYIQKENERRHTKERWTVELNLPIVLRIIKRQKLNFLQPLICSLKCCRSL
jgi:Nucleoside phosphorylase